MRVRYQCNVYSALEPDGAVMQNILEQSVVVRLHRAHLVEGILPHMIMEQELIFELDASLVRDDDAVDGFPKKTEEEPVVYEEHEQ